MERPVVDEEKITVVTNLLSQTDIRVTISENGDDLELTFATGKAITLPLMLDRGLESLRRPDEAPFSDEIFRRAIGRALYEGFHVVEFLGDDHDERDRLLSGIVFRDQNGRALTYEERKSYTQPIGSHNYSCIKLYSPEEFGRFVVRSGDRVNIADYLIRSYLGSDQ